MPLYDDFGTVPFTVNNGVKIYNCADSKSGLNQSVDLKKTYLKTFENRFLIAVLLSSAAIISIGLFAYIITI